MTPSSRLERLRQLRAAEAQPPAPEPSPPVALPQKAPQAAPAPLPLPVPPPAQLEMPPPVLPTPPARPLNLSSLPAHLAPLVQAAARGELPTGPVILASGLVLDLGGYVLAWARVWPSDAAHTLRRLEEARTVWGRA